MSVQPETSLGEVYKTLRTLPGPDSARPVWQYRDPTKELPGMLWFRDRAGKQRHPLPLRRGDNITLLRDPVGNSATGLAPGDTLCLIYNTNIHRAFLLRFRPKRYASFVGEAYFEGSHDEMVMLSYPPGKVNKGAPPTLYTLSDVNIAKRMALFLEPPSTHWNGCVLVELDTPARYAGNLPPR